MVDYLLAGTYWSFTFWYLLVRIGTVLLIIHLPVSIDTYSYLFVPIGTCTYRRYLLYGYLFVPLGILPIDTSWHILVLSVLFGTYRYLLVPVGTYQVSDTDYRYILAPYLLVHIDTYWYLLVPIGTY